VCEEELNGEGQLQGEGGFPEEALQVDAAVFLEDYPLCFQASLLEFVSVSRF